MTLETADLVHEAVLLVASGFDNNGEVTVESAVDINCRWLETHEDGLDTNGNPVRIDVSVVVDQAVPIGSILWEGNTEDNPTPNAGKMYKVNHYRRASDVKGNHTRYTLKLTAYNDQLPAETA